MQQMRRVWIGRVGGAIAALGAVVTGWGMAEPQHLSNLSANVLSRPLGEKPSVSLTPQWQDMGDRLQVTTRWIPVYDFPSFNSQRLDEQLAQYTHYLATVGSPDILVVGSSRALQGIDPAILEARLAEQGRPLRVYNFSVNGATAQVVDLLVRQILSTEQLPKLIIWADGSRAFNSGRPDATFAQITASSAYTRLTTEGDRPIQYVAEQQFQLGDAPWCEQGTRPFPSGLGQWSSETKLPTAERLLQQCADLERRGSGWSRALAQSLAPPSTTLTLQGFLPVPTRFDPAVYYQTVARVPGQYDGSYVPFQLLGNQTNAVVQLVNHARRHDISLVVVNLPLSQDYLDPVRQSYEQQFQLHLRQLAIAQGFTLVDLNVPSLQRNDYFADPSHLNQYGAIAVAEAIAQQSHIPWDVAQAPDLGR